jgi:carbonic anhydrase
MNQIAATASLTFGLLLTSTLAQAGGTAPDAATAQQRLLEGNRRFAAARLSHTNQTAVRRVEIAAGQNPFALIVGCADSRVPPEILFDQGLGDLFVIRLAGHVIDDAVVASIEYAVEHLGIRYVMVLGHERCGAVEATVKGGHEPGHIGALAAAIQPAVIEAANRPGDKVDNVVRANVARVVRQLKSSAPVLKERVDRGDLTIAGARYDLDDGTVAILP